MRFRSWIVTTFAIGIAQGILSLLLVLQHDAIYSDLLRQRVSVIAQTTAEAFRPILDLNLPISMLRDGEKIVGRGVKIDPNIIAVHAVNPSGIVAHTTGTKPATISDDVLSAMRLSDHDQWGQENSDAIYSGFTLRREKGGQMGGAVIVEYPRSPLEEASRNIASITLRYAFFIFVGTSALAFCLIYLSLNRPRWKLAELRGVLEGPQPAQHFQHAELQSESSALDVRLARLARTLREAGLMYGRAERAIADPAADLDQPRPSPTGENGANLDSGMLTSVFLGRLLPITIILIVASSLLLGAVVIRAVAKSVEPELAARTDLIGTVVSDNVQRALDSGIELDQIVGADRFFGEMLERLPEVAYIAIATGRIVIEAGERIDPYLAPPRERRDVRSHPIMHDGEEVAYVVIDIDPGLITKKFRDAFLDAMVILLVAVLLASEAMLLLTGRTLTVGLERMQLLSAMQAAGDFSRRASARGRGSTQYILQVLTGRAQALHDAFAQALASATDADKTTLRKIGERFGLSGGRTRPIETSSFTDIRLALFLFAAADELPLAFLPIYTRASGNLWPWLDMSVLIALPLAGYLFAIAMISPYARVLVERFGVRNIFVFASIPTLAAHIGLYAAATAQEIIFWRTVTGLGYALVTLAAQDYVLSVAERSQRDKMLGTFTLVLFGGIFSGVALGGVLADRLGQANVFLVSAALIAVAALLSNWLISEDIGRQSADDATRTASGKWAALRYPGLLALIFGIAIPGAVVMQAFVSYLVALILDARGATSAEIGRILMLFFLAIMAVSTFSGAIAERLRVPPPVLCTSAALLSGLSLLPAAAAPGQLTIALAMIGAGIGSALLRGIQVSIALTLAETSLSHIGPTAILGALRTGERLGSIAGLVVIAGIAGLAGYEAAILAIAAWSLAGGAIYAAMRWKQFLTTSYRGK
ncbi:MAG: MFS transporter [Rhodobacteraceae bacterium]|nr:MFS transporter [Paracoccaceae bacterium]